MTEEDWKRWWKMFRLGDSSLHVLVQTARRGHDRSLLIGTLVHLCLFTICLSVCCQEGKQEVQILEATCTEGNGNIAGLQGQKEEVGCIKLRVPPPPPQGMPKQPHGRVWALPGWLLRHPAGQHTAESRRISWPCHLAAWSQWNCSMPTTPPPVSLCVWQRGEVVKVREAGGMLACCSVKGSAC